MVKAFFFTSLREQAERYSFRFIKRNQKAVLNIYDFSGDWHDWKVKVFEQYDGEWLDFVLSCRAEEVVADYDMIVGGVANDKVFDTLNLFLDGFIQRDEALRRLVYEKPNIQYCIRTDAMLRQCLTFKNCIDL